MWLFIDQFSNPYFLYLGMPCCFPVAVEVLSVSKLDSIWTLLCLNYSDVAIRLLLVYLETWSDGLFSHHISPLPLINGSLSLTWPLLRSWLEKMAARCEGSFEWEVGTQQRVVLQLVDWARDVITPHCAIPTCYKKSHRTSDLERCFGMTLEVKKWHEMWNLGCEESS